MSQNQGVFVTNPTAGTKNALGVTAAAVIKAGAGRVSKISVLGVVGTGGALTINDCAAVADAAVGNQVFTTAGTVAVGTVIALDFPCVTGIVVSAVPTGGTPRFAISYT
jgi:hypothetical protein